MNFVSKIISNLFFQGANTKLFNLNLVRDMWLTVVKKRHAFLRSIIILSAVVLTLNIMITMGK